MCLTIHIATSLHLFSACTLDVTSTVMTRMHVRSSMRAHSPLSGSSVNESCAQDTEQKHGKHFFIFSFFHFFIFRDEMDTSCFLEPCCMQCLKSGTHSLVYKMNCHEERKTPGTGCAEQLLHNTHCTEQQQPHSSALCQTNLHSSHCADQKQHTCGLNWKGFWSHKTIA